MASKMRDIMIEDSEKFKGLKGTDGKILNNISGESVGVDGDEKKIAGGRWNLEELKKITLEIDGQEVQAVMEDKTGTTKSGLVEDENGYVKLYISTEELLAHPDIEAARSPMGGYQGSTGLFQFFDYSPGSLPDIIAESYAGTHDMFNSFIWYDDMGNIRTDINPALKKIGDITNYTNVLLATPFAASELFDAQTWEIVDAILGAQ
jgi:filamentous hemagglutinin